MACTHSVRTQLIWMTRPVSVMVNFDEAPVSFNGDFACERPRWFLSLARSVETPREFLFLGWFLIWARFSNIGGG